MSFSSTPLGQGRRLDHHTFLNKPTSSTSSANSQITTARRTNSPPRPHIPASYAYGAPTLGSRSPPKPNNSLSSANDSLDDSDQPALVRYARLKQREQTQHARASGPRTANTQPHPEKWSVKDTSVNIASAFHQAASTSLEDSMPPPNPNDSWASTTTKKSTLPRSTSVEYETQSQTTVNRRLAVPPNRLGPRVPKPLSKNASLRHVPDSEGEESGIDNSSYRRENGRGKSPFEQLYDVTKRLAPATFFLRSPSQEPDTTHNGDRSADKSGEKDGSSYEYSAEEREFQAQTAAATQKPTSKRTAAAHKRGRMSVDNKAYRPSMSDLEESDEEFTEDGKRTRRKKAKKGGAAGGPLTTLPVAGYDKRKKKRRTKGNGIEGEESSEEQEEEQDRVSEQRSARGTTPVVRQPSIPRSTNGALLQPPIHRESIPPEPRYDSSHHDTSIDLEQALDPTSESDEPPAVDGMDEDAHSSFSIGATLGKGVHWTFSSAWSIFSFLPMAIGRLLGFVADVLFVKPLRLAANANPAPITWVAKYVVVALSMYAAWYGLRNGYFKMDFLPSRSAYVPPYHPPEMPPADVAELASRLQRLENALASLSMDAQRSKTYIEGDTKSQAELVGRLGALESRVQKETARILDAESKLQTSASHGLQSVKQEVAVLAAQLRAQREDESRKAQGPASDDEARAKLQALEERLGSVEGGVKEALDLGKNIGKVGAAAGSSVAWWNKASGKDSVTIKSTDGQDVTLLLKGLVDSAVSRFSKDILARPDFALHSGGARVIPSLTSDTYEIQPQGLGPRILGQITGNGYAIGRPPVTALHHESHNGYCWPFAGSQGQLGVALSSPAYITDITIDHVSRDEATDLRSAPRHMELWGLVEGKDNIEKVKEWQEARREQARAEAELSGETFVEEEYPTSLPQSPQYLRIANFTYNIYAPTHIQTFPVPQDLQDLRVDFGVVALLVKSNWGRELTCLYRLRVHGEMAADIPAPLPEDSISV